MHVHVDRERCQGHNRCYALAPELFDVDDLGNSLEEKARLAVANCPERAISMSE